MMFWSETARCSKYVAAVEEEVHYEKKHGKLKFILLVSKLQQPVSGLRLARLLLRSTSEIVGGFILDVIFNLGKNSEGATCRVRLVFMTFHSTEPERSI